MLFYPWFHSEQPSSKLDVLEDVLERRGSVLREAVERGQF